MADFAIYWQRYRKESGSSGLPVIGWLTSRESLVNRLSRGDRVWLFIGGDACGKTKQKHRAYLAQLLVVDEWGDFGEYDPDFNRSPRFQIVGDENRCVLVDPPLLVDQIFRPAGSDPDLHIGQARQTPFMLDGIQEAQLLAQLRAQRHTVYTVATSS